MHMFKVLWIINFINSAAFGANVEIGDTRAFRKMVNLPVVRMVPLNSNPQSYASTLTACAAMCKKRSKECFSFVYDKGGRECHLGSWSVPERDTYIHGCGGKVQERILAKIKGTLYTSACCTEGYSLRTMGRSQSKCLRHVKSKKNFDAALDDCKSDGGQLVTFKTDAEFDFVKWSMNCLGDTWVGIRDNCHYPGIDCRQWPSQRKLFWVDKEELTESSRDKIIQDLDNSGFSEGCIQIGGKYDNFNDDQCSSRFEFVCEKDPLKEGIYCP
ncbi:hypothetical protein RRG08_025265 [Elysia crispata]|uniref:C-type lectin domain-containing protein n=1 Tax=Elysia crispata TaxID=231223 RepID=A0AAE1AA30_9GAST|nr:hypothetical protein RRG08_025265 [Elysia crispata]